MKKRLLSIFMMSVIIALFVVTPASAYLVLWNGYYCSVSSDGVSIASCPNQDHITIPNEITGYPVKAISSGAFEDCDRLTSIDIPDSITYIGKDAFLNSGYYNNEDNWENGVLYIGDYLIKAKSNLTGTYEVKESTRCIAAAAFADCNNLTSITIPSGVTNISENTFSNCTRLTSITMSDRINHIEESAFLNSGYYNNEDNWENGVLYIGDYLIEAKNNLTGTYKIKENTRCIAAAAFADCDNLTSVTIPDSIETIPTRAFDDCSSLSKILIPSNVECIEAYAFCDCSMLSDVTISNGVTKIGEHAFFYCTSLRDITIPKSVTSIEPYAFSACKNLTNIVTSDNVTSIGIDAFYGTSYYDNQQNWENDVLYIGNHLIKAKSNLNGAYEIKQNTKNIACDAFVNCGSLTSITIPNTVVDITTSGLDGCANLTDVYYTGTQEQWNQITSNKIFVFTLPYATTHMNHIPTYECIENITEVDNTKNGTLVFAARIKANYIGKDYGVVVNNKKFYGAKPGDIVGDYNGSSKFTFDSWTGEFSIVVKGLPNGLKTYRYFIDDKVTNEATTVFPK